MGGGWWITSLLNDPSINGQVWVVSWIVWVVLSICLHELAHGWTAIQLGDDTPRLAGHMTWNPMVHMGPYSLLMFIFIGIAWGAMPVNPSKLKGRYGDAIVSLAGPLMNLILATIALIVLIIWKPLCQGQITGSVTISHPLSTNMTTFLHLGAMLNIVLMLFNLLPVPPLDGGRILMDILPRYRRIIESENGRWLALGVFIIFFIFMSSLIFVLANAAISGITELFWGIFFPNM
ncbi:MAG: site-2 protease family protein [Phycisphaerales bacterium]